MLSISWRICWIARPGTCSPDMARTDEGALLSVRHRQGQLALRAQALRDFQRIWPVWTGDEKSFRLLVAATVPLVQSHRQTSGALAGAYFEMFRRTERVGGTATASRGRGIDSKPIVTSLYVTGMNTVKRGLDSGFSIQAAKQNAFVAVSGAITRHVLNGSRDVILGSVAADPQARGYARVTGGDPCSFCAMLAANGAAYGEDTVDFEAHDHCSCSSEPLYADSALPPDSQRFKDLWNETMAEHRTFDEESGKWRNPPDALNKFRQALTAQAE